MHMIWYCAQNFLLKITKKSHFSWWPIRWNKPLTKSLIISKKGGSNTKLEWCIHHQVYWGIVDSYHSRMAPNSRMVKTCQSVEPTTQHLKRKELESMQNWKYQSGGERDDREAKRTNKRLPWCAILKNNKWNKQWYCK